MGMHPSPGHSHRAREKVVPELSRSDDVAVQKCHPGEDQVLLPCIPRAVEMYIEPEHPWGTAWGAPSCPGGWDKP